MSNPLTLPLPDRVTDWLKGKDGSTIREHSVAVDLPWLKELLAAHELNCDFLGERISRGQLFTLAEEARDSADRALDLLWNTLAWGADSTRQDVRADFPFIIEAVAAEPDRRAGDLMRAAELAGDDPVGAFRTLNAGRSKIPRLGPAFFTKFLYFSGAGAPWHPSLIIDRFVAAELRHSGWAHPDPARFDEVDYGRYTELAHRWADEAEVPRIDLIELALFSLKGATA
ncbi:hypothetical protein [Corynebacterium halotolerans]|uniref:Uncharacterized protein n=1 Tax=Corynebacterium halotolerans YIM 70093 = DSM 44683 TaxID=1121362 RepID=M1NIX5_9CORY|nr:hypothetical protein [Corynebacterium halotolerans]AGF71378.1 hypothetical protein A605_01820 [Corynebacterium halotolerans YIM 70093 = DSM 44683]